MIKLYSGTPGSGKSYHASCDIIQWARRGKNIIANFPVDLSKIKRVKTQPLYVVNSELTPRFLITYSQQHNRRGRESQCLIVIDEAQLMFNSRLSLDKDRMQWIQFFSQHRKLGYEIILIAQSKRMIDRQIRELIEDDIKHRKLNNYGLFGFFIGLLFFNRSIFYCCDMWMGTDDKVGGQWLLYHKKNADIYDTYRIFDKTDSQTDGGGVAPRAGAPAAVPSESGGVSEIRKMYINRLLYAIKKRASARNLQS